MENRVKELREYLYQVVNFNNYEEILKISEELDELILQYLKQRNCTKESKNQ